MQLPFASLTADWRAPRLDSLFGRRQRRVQSRLRMRNSFCGFRRDRSANGNPSGSVAAHRSRLARQPGHRFQRAALSLDAGLLRLGRRAGVTALLATLGSEWTAKRLTASEPLASGMSFLAAFAIYESLLYFASVIAQSGVENYTASISRTYSSPSTPSPSPGSSQ